MGERSVYIFRHGQTFYNEKGIFTGWKDAQLSPRGLRSAKKIALKLKAKKFDVAYYTRLSRSKDTLNEVLKFHPECKTLIQDDRMIERSYGILEGTSHESFIKKIGRQGYDLRIEGNAIENFSPKLRRKIEKFLGEKEYEAIHRGYDVAVPDGESFAMIEKRVKSFIRDMKILMKKRKVNVAISAHGNSIRIFRKIMEHASREEAVKWLIPYDKYYEYKVST